MTSDRDRMTNDRDRTGEWNRADWVGEGQGAPDDIRTDGGGMPRPAEDPAAGDRWNKNQWVGDQGDGAPRAEDPDLMPEGESGLSGDRHTPGEQRWSQGQDLVEPATVRDVTRPIDRS